jgi:hypothetical protein
MIRKVITVEDWAEIRRLHRSEQMPIKAIARHLGISRNTVKRALAAQDPPKYQRRPRGSIVDPFEPQIRELLRKVPTMPATVIAERIGWQRSMTVLKDRVRQLRPVLAPGWSTYSERRGPPQSLMCQQRRLQFAKAVPVRRPTRRRHRRQTQHATRPFDRSVGSCEQLPSQRVPNNATRQKQTTNL